MAGQNAEWISEARSIIGEYPAIDQTFGMAMGLLDEMAEVIGPAWAKAWVAEYWRDYAPFPGILFDCFDRPDRRDSIAILICLGWPIPRPWFDFVNEMIVLCIRLTPWPEDAESGGGERS